MADLIVTRARVERNGAVQNLLISEGRIAAAHAPAGPEIRTAVCLEADGRLLLPGLVNVHTHLDKALLAGRVPNETGTIAEARARLKAAKAEFTKQDVFERAAEVLRRSVQFGVTALRSHVDIDPVVGLKGVEALLALRERTEGVIDLQIVAFPQEGIVEQPGTEGLMREALRLGADVVGGHLSIAADPQALRQQTDLIFKLAAEFDRDIDVHVDYDLDRDYGRDVSTHSDGHEYPDNLGVVYLAEKTMTEGFQGRVTASHLCALDSVPPALRRNVIDLLRRAEISVIALPANNMYVHGRQDATGARRGVTRLRELREGGVRVAVGTDNIRDPFDPFGSADVVQNAFLASIACHLERLDDYWSMLDFHTVCAAKILRLPDYGIAPGCFADFVVLEARSLEDLLNGDTTRRWVVKHGVVVAAAEIMRTIHPALAAKRLTSYGGKRA